MSFWIVQVIDHTLERTFIFVRTRVEVGSNQQKSNPGIEGATKKIIKITTKLKSWDMTSVFVGDYNINHLEPLKCTNLLDKMYRTSAAKPLINTETTVCASLFGTHIKKSCPKVICMPTNTLYRSLRLPGQMSMA